MLNACNSAQSDPAALQTGPAALQTGTDAASLALAFLLAGAQIVIGTQWPIPDGRAKGFSFLLYQKLLEGLPVGEAMRQTRQQCWEERRNDPL